MCIRESLREQQDGCYHREREIESQCVQTLACVLQVGAHVSAYVRVSACVCVGGCVCECDIA